MRVISGSLLTTYQDLTLLRLITLTKREGLFWPSQKYNFWTPLKFCWLKCKRFCNCKCNKLGWLRFLQFGVIKNFFKCSRRYPYCVISSETNWVFSFIYLSDYIDTLWYFLVKSKFTYLHLFLRVTRVLLKLLCS